MGLFSTSKPEAKQCYIKDRPLKCLHCGHDMFHLRQSALPMAPATLSDWGQRGAACYECADCGLIHWFAQKDAKWWG